MSLPRRRDVQEHMARRSIAGLRAIVTGASSGIGRALVVELIRGGARVVAMARRRGAVERTGSLN